MARFNCVTVLAPAKLNLALDVVGLLPGGYHDLDMTMQAITLYERVVLRRSPYLDLRLPGSLVAPNNKNTAIKAALAFFDYTVEEPIHSVSTEVWKYVDGSWKRYGHVFGNIEPGEYRMGFRLTSSGYEIFDISDSGHNTYTYQDPIDFDGSAVGGVTLGDFHSIDCATGLAVAVTFSDAPTD